MDDPSLPAASPLAGRPCPRCETEGVLTPERLTALAAGAPAPVSLRAGEALYRRRLIRCGACEALKEQVLCAYCGCFVQFRAAILNARCPHPGGDRWE
ncbi:MAG: DUF6171 family protein [Treponema sp.]|nr:DUF6171 family protein [Treponema sp.]